MSISNTGSVDLESVLNVRRRTLASIGEKASSRARSHYTDTIYLKREDNSNSLFSIDSKILIFGELQFLCTIFERYTSSITVYEDKSTDTTLSSPSTSAKPSFSTVEENDQDEEDLPMVTTLRQTSISSSKGSSSPPHAPGSPSRKKTLSSVGRSQTIGTSVSDYSLQNLEGKRYGCIELPNTSMIEILEILFRTRMELVDESSDYDNNNVLHQNFVFSKVCPILPKSGRALSRSTSFAGT
ncbi:unnamed protein product [Adineta steineri]|uniref:Uncharacterized protein n=1 Tax=Adineta steineri TaxID=433720 RepID=A0A818LBM3_9BILA|nr:unnamed protein product [Adineta steineri]CAF3569530.1 unnamed protein product [Adineta steineri]